MYKIMQVLTDTNIGGGGMWLINFLKAFDRTKLDVVVVLPEGSMLEPMVTDLGIRVVSAASIADKSFSRPGIKELIKIIKSEKPQVIHTHASLSARIAAKLCGVCAVNTRHCLEQKKKFPLSFVSKIANNFLSRRIVAVSYATAKNLEEEGVSKNKIEVVYNGVFPFKTISESEKASIKRQYGIAPDEIVVGTVARLESVKRHDLFFRIAQIALEKNKKLKFLVVGDGSLLSTLKSLCNLLGIEQNVIFTGYIKDVNDIMNIIDINVLCSEKEALSISLIEGMSIGKVAVATDSGGPGEVIENGVNGILVPNLDFEALADAVLKLANDSNLREKMGEAGIKTAKEKFSAEVMAKKLENIYISLAERK